jgi:hypothetical protein
MESVVAFGCGLVIGFGAFLVWLGASNKKDAQAARSYLRRKLPSGVRPGHRPEVRRVILRPVNLDQPPSRVTQGLFRQRPTRKLRDDEPRDID